MGVYDASDPQADNFNLIDVNAPGGKDALTGKSTVEIGIKR
jgi:hypothetical protein